MEDKWKKSFRKKLGTQVLESVVDEDIIINYWTVKAEESQIFKCLRDQKTVGGSSGSGKAWNPLKTYTANTQRTQGIDTYVRVRLRIVSRVSEWRDTVLIVGWKRTEKSG